MPTAVLQQPLLFISDVHLGGFSDEENSRIESELIQLLDHCQRNDIHLAILGDLFDYWMEYPNRLPGLGNILLERFEAFNSELGPTLFITGNHDNWMRGYLEEKGFELEHEYQRGRLAGKQLMALHGDGLSDPALGLPRPPIHRLLRNPKFISFYQTLLPPKAGLFFMKYFARLTRLLERKKENAEVLNRWARNTLRESETDIIVCGHDHIPRRKQFAFGTYINLGTFYKHRTMALCDNDELSLVKWEPRLQSIKPFDDSNLNE